MRFGRFTGFEATRHEPGIALLQLDQPERLNGMTQALKRDLVETLLQAQMDDSVRVVVFTGSGRAPESSDRERLSAPIPPGHDTEIGTYEGLRALSQPLNLAVRGLDKLSIAALNGVAIQTGFSLALACDFRIAAESARLGSATLRFGLLPDEGGQYLLVQHLGVARALDFLMHKRIVSAAEAHALGLVHEVVPDGRLLGRALELARELAEGPQVAMRLLKRSLYNAAQLSFELACDEIAAKTAISDHHPDAREGVRAFQEKRAPRFNRWLEK
ncbi:MAG TPA: enoyl-CoA hydratase-related protein [Myxococcota bacterium]|nr:enoyl-CoA hydratase-related protein [Myxococcota bacterium]